MSDKIYAGSGKTRSGNYGEFYAISVCLDDIPQEHITKASNGKQYVNLTVNKKKETDQYGKDLSVQVDTWKPDKAATPKKEQGHVPKQEYEDDSHLPF